MTDRKKVMDEKVKYLNKIDPGWDYTVDEKGYLELHCPECKKGFPEGGIYPCFVGRNDPTDSEKKNCGAYMKRHGNRMTDNNLVVLGTHPDSLMWFDPVKHANDEVWGMAHHDNIIEKSTRCFEAHSPEIVWEHGGNQHVNRLKWIANNMPLITAYQWPMSLGKNHFVCTNDDLADKGFIRKRAQDWNNDGTPLGETPYVESSIGYILAYGLSTANHWDNLYLYGINMDGSDEYTYQRPNIAYFIGKYEGRGTKVHLPPKCGLLNSQWTGRVYGHPRNINDITYHLKPTSPRWKDIDNA